MAKTSEVFHKGKTIFRIDFSNVDEVNEITEIINEASRYIRSKPFNSVLTLTNIQNMHYSSEIKEHFNQFMKGNKPYVKASTVIGLNLLQQMLYNSLVKLTGRDVRLFSNEQAAKDWLCEQRN
ncbi:MAG TPA: hypothetical protein VHO50_08235 [Bacteroidales bacterium]|nr:hypothetical protein [Bacteroidales bacterium]